MRAVWVALCIGAVAITASAGTITLSADIELPAPDPDPNQVITVYFHSDAPILFMNLRIRINGDATLVGTMDQTDGSLYGWDGDSIVTSTVHPDNSIELFGLNWTENAAATVGYLQFRCNSALNDVITCAEYWLCYSPFDPNGPAYIDPTLYIFDPNYPENWIDPNSVSFGGDWDNSGFVDLQDFAIVSQQWQETPAVPALVPVIGGRPDEGWITITAGQPNADTMLIYAYVNGEYLGQVYMGGHKTPKYYDLTESGNGPHEIKFIAMDIDENIVHLPPFAYEPNEPLPLKYCILPSMYEPNQPVPFDFCNPEGVEVTVSVYGNGGELVWSQVITGEPNNAHIPANVLSQLLTVDSIQFTAAGRQGPIIKPFPVKCFSEIDREVKALMIIPDTQLFNYNPRNRYAVLRAFLDRGINVLPLEREQATWENVAKYGQFGTIRYIYFLGHGNYCTDTTDPNAVLRTWNVFADTCVVSCKYSEFPEGQAPSWCRPLPDALEQSVPT
jgi:hypothetical protein